MLVGLLILGLMAGTLVRIGLARRTQGQQEERAIQADFLADAGIDRAVAHLRADPKFAGETWHVTPADLGRPWSARVAIIIRRDPPEEREGPTIAVTTELVVSPTTTIRQSRALLWHSTAPNPR